MKKSKKLLEYVVCLAGKGYQVDSSENVEKRLTGFPENSVGLVRETVRETTKKRVTVLLIGEDKKWSIPIDDVQRLNVYATGDNHKKKICNRCLRLLPVASFAKNQRNKHGILRRPSCNKCRTDIDKRAPKSSQAKKKEKERPQKGQLFKCPICQKRSIVGVTAKIVADHDHHTGNIRDFICDSCNTGLGRFKDDPVYLNNAIDYLKDRDTLSADEE